MCTDARVLHNVLLPCAKDVCKFYLGVFEADMCAVNAHSYRDLPVLHVAHVQVTVSTALVAWGGASVQGLIMVGGVPFQ